MLYIVRVYKNSGFNAVNVPDSPTLLNSGAFQYVDLDSVDLLQDGFLSSVRVRAGWDDVKNGDYCKIGNWYYFVTGVRMLAVDSAELSIVPDFLTTAGGPAALTYLDGVARRMHVGSDDYGQWCIEDEYLTPAQPLQLDVETVDFQDNDSTIVLVESTLDLGLMGSVRGSTVYEDLTGSEVIVPTSYPKSGDHTHYSMDGQDQDIDLGTTVFPAEHDADEVSSVIERGITNLRSLGIENAVVRRVVIPEAFVSLSYGRESVAEDVLAGTPPRYSTSNAENVGIFQTLDAKLIDGDKSWQYVDTITAKRINSISALAFEYDDSVKNKRVLYGNNNLVGILTTAGNRLESTPEEVKAQNDTYITVSSTCDPHLNGRPYHRFKTMNGDSSPVGFWRNAIAGLPWKDLPIVYTEKQGSALDRVSFENQRELADAQLALTEKQSIFGMIGSGINAGASILGGGGGGVAAVGIAGVTGQYVNYELAAAMYEKQKQIEAREYVVSQKVVSPEISVDYNAEAFRDFYGERVILYRYRPTSSDLARMDKILTMYGYAVAEPIENVSFSNRQYFNYVEASVSVGGDIPRWLADGVSIQMSNGVRIWHVKPNSSYYNNNPISI